MLFDLEQFHWMREWRVYGIINMIGLGFIYSFFFYYLAFIDRYLFDDIESRQLKLYAIIMGLVVCIFNYIYFFSKDQWKKQIKEFYKWPKKKNLIGTFIVYSIILFIFINLFYSMNLYVFNS